MRRVCLLIAALAMAPPAHAASQNSEKGSFSILFENDLFYKADHDYTNGTELAYTTAPGDTPGWAVRTAEALPFFGDQGEVRTRYALGQVMFTPQRHHANQPADQ